MNLDDVARIHPDYGLLILYWRNRIVPPADLPRRTGIDLMELHTIAPRMVIVDAETDGAGQSTYRWRFSGTQLREIIGIEMTGKSLDEVADPKTKDESVDAYDAVVNNREANYWTRHIGIQSLDRSFITYSRLMLPLLGEGDAVDHLIGLYVFDEDHTRSATTRPEQWRFAIE